MTGNVEVLSRAGNEFAAFLPQATTSGSLPPPFSVPSTGLSGSLRPLFYLRRILFAANPPPRSVTTSRAEGKRQEERERERERTRCAACPERETRPEFRFARQMRVDLFLISRRCCAQQRTASFRGTRRAANSVS